MAHPVGLAEYREDIGHMSSIIRIATEDNLDVLIAASSGTLCPGWQGGREGHPLS
jgi:hypothetical protein